MDEEIERWLGALGPTSTVEQRLDTLGRLIESWHGPDFGRKASPFDWKEVRPIPTPLRWCYEKGSRRSRVLSGQNRFLGPDELEMLDGHLLFYVENQGVYLWATDPGGEDPPVWGQFNGDEAWVQEEVSLSEFLIQICLFEAIMSAAYGACASWADQKMLDEVTRPLQAVPIGAWRWPSYPSRFWSGGGKLVFAGPNGSSVEGARYSIWIGANSAEPLQYLKMIGAQEWDYTAF